MLCQQITLLRGKIRGSYSSGLKNFRRCYFRAYSQGHTIPAFQMYDSIHRKRRPIKWQQQEQIIGKFSGQVSSPKTLNVTMSSTITTPPNNLPLLLPQFFKAPVAFRTRCGIFFSTPSTNFSPSCPNSLHLLDLGLKIRASRDFSYTISVCALCRNAPPDLIVQRTGLTLG